jgi:hypothetical protein
MALVTHLDLLYELLSLLSSGICVGFGGRLDLLDYLYNGQSDYMSDFLATCRGVMRVDQSLSSVVRCAYRHEAATRLILQRPESP